ncbi:HD-GYP domain-containing protein [Desulfogranum mediterraneum]|uniref:HD-GYP domain-containing protein n=1 Tax=Desulfogranum mediterraneum TaxID=160661 RepID=UPI00041D158D|nr:HD-GYP domain-containing protein [Desulfogranum mediterraneum]
MIKRVKVIDLVPGVYIHDFNLEWNDENIFIEPGPVRDDSMIKILHSWGIKEVYIDTSKGENVREAGRPAAHLQSHHQLSGNIDLEGWQESEQQYVPLSKELKEAKNILRNAITVVQETVKQVESGQAPNAKNAYAVVRQMKKSIIRNRDALILLTRIRNKDEYTLYHSISVSSMVLGLCGHSGVSEKQSLDIAVGALFHDIGKTIIPSNILNKPGKLNDFEYNEIKKHAEFSVDLLRNSKGLPVESFDIALHHHERFDGSGYPHGLSGAEINYGTQLVSICDVYDAITSARCYKDKVDVISGLQIMYRMAGQHFSKDILYNFIRFIGVYPVGSYVETNEGTVGVVVGSTASMCQPVVQICYDQKMKRKVNPYLVNLSETGGAVKGYVDKNMINP